MWHGFRMFAHNPEVSGSNPLPATEREPEYYVLWFFVPQRGAVASSAHGGRHFSKNRGISNTTVRIRVNRSSPGLSHRDNFVINCKIHPRTKMKALSPEKLAELFDAVKDMLSAMTLLGGRDTETDLFANPDGYHTIVSAKTDGKPAWHVEQFCARKAFWAAVFMCVNSSNRF